MVEIIDDLEKFLYIQRKRLESDKECLDKVTAIGSEPGSRNNVQPTSADHPSRAQANASTQTEVPEELVLTSPKTDDSKLMSIKSMHKDLNDNSLHDHPKYGLPGIGEYEEKYKQLRLEEKRELNRYLQQAIEAKKNAKNTAVDYEDILTKKRNEELRYREINGGLFDIPTTSLDTSDSSSALNENVAFHRVRSIQSDLNENVKKEADALNEVQLTEMDDFYRLPTISQSEPLPSIRSSHFRSADNIRVGPPLGLSSLTPRPSTLPDLDRSRELPPNPLVGVVPQENDANMRNARQRAAEYRIQLDQQIHDQKLQRKRLNNDERTIPQLDPLSNNLFNRYGNAQLSSDFYPWGRSGAGAPNRDLHGNVITHRKGLNNSNVVNTALPFYEKSVHTLDGHRKLPERWHEGHWPLPEEKQLVRPQHNYQDELREQIEQKRRREQEERDMQRREDERLARRFEAQREKLQAEYEAEITKQRRREEEQRRKAERILQSQENERKDALAKKQKTYEREWWEKDTTKPASPPAAIPKQDTPKQPTSSSSSSSSHHAEMSPVAHFEAAAAFKPDLPATSHFETPPQSENDADERYVPLSDHTGSKGSEADDESTLSEFPVKDRRKHHSFAKERSPSPPIPTTKERRISPRIFESDRSASPPIPTLRYKDDQRRDDFTFIELEYQSENDSMYEKENVPVKSFERLPSSPRKAKNRRSSPYRETNNSFQVMSPPVPALTKLGQNERLTELSQLNSPVNRSSRQSSRNSRRPTGQENDNSWKLVGEENSSRRVVPQENNSSDDLIDNSSRSSVLEPLRVPMISQEDLPPITSSVDSSSPSLSDVEIQSNGKNQMDILSQLSAMRHQLHLERKRLQEQMKRDDKYEVFDPRLDILKSTSAERRKRGHSQFPSKSVAQNKLHSKLNSTQPATTATSAPAFTSRKNFLHHSSTLLEFTNTDGLDVNEIASRNRERLNNLEKWKHENGLGDTKVNDADNVLESFMRQQT